MVYRIYFFHSINWQAHWHTWMVKELRSEDVSHTHNNLCCKSAENEILFSKTLRSMGSMGKWWKMRYLQGPRPSFPPKKRYKKLLTMFIIMRLAWLAGYFFHPNLASPKSGPAAKKKKNKNGSKKMLGRKRLEKWLAFFFAILNFVYPEFVEKPSEAPCAEGVESEWIGSNRKKMSTEW